MFFHEPIATKRPICSSSRTTSPASHRLLFRASSVLHATWGVSFVADRCKSDLRTIRAIATGWRRSKSNSCRPVAGPRRAGEAAGRATHVKHGYFWATTDHKHVGLFSPAPADWRTKQRRPVAELDGVFCRSSVSSGPKLPAASVRAVRQGTTSVLGYYSLSARDGKYGQFLCVPVAPSSWISWSSMQQVQHYIANGAATDQSESPIHFARDRTKLLLSMVMCCVWSHWSQRATNVAMHRWGDTRSCWHLTWEGCGRGSLQEPWR